MTFGEALELLKQGKMLCRKGWNGKDLFIFMQVPAIIGKDTVPKMTSLPQSVKDEFAKRSNDENYQVSEIYYSDQIALVNSSNLIQGWSPSTPDSLAKDWCLYK